MTDMVRWSLRWSNPHSDPPIGDRIKAAVIVPRGTPCPPEITEQHIPRSGWAVSWEIITQKPIRRWSQKAKARVRRRNLRRRLEKKFPLFADLFIAAELDRRPAYYEASDV